MRSVIIAILLVLLFNTTVNAQNEREPKVGLVLSGGGAKGLAHIGALKVIDSLGIRVDYIAGTSMGAIIGSLYASGYSGKAIDSIFKRVDFDAIINDYTPREAKTLYERINTEKYAVSLPFDKFKVKLPSALSRGQNTFNLLSKLTLHVNDIEKFEDLPIPFFCIATDIETGQPVILDQGSLAQAIKASGAFPSLFQPVVINDQLLIDGGVTNNYPIYELIEKGMDVIIGVDVQDGLSNRIDLSSAPEILFQINNFRTIGDMVTKSKITDIYIKPDITAFNVVSFDYGKQIIKNGEIASRLQLDKLKALATKQIKKPKPTTVIKTPDSLQINQVYFKGLNNYTLSYVLGKLKLKPFNKISYKKFISGTNNLVATNNFESFVYKLMPSKHNGIEGYDLYTELRETNKTMALKFGLHYDGLYKSALLANITKKQLLFKNDVMSLDLIAGDNVRYNFEYYIDKGFYWSIGVRSVYNEFSKNVSASILLEADDFANFGVNKIDTRLTDLSNRVFVQTQFKNNAALTLGAEYKCFRATTETVVSSENQNNTVFDNTDYFSVFGNIIFDSFDNKYYPNKGVYFKGDFNLYLYASGFNADFEQFSSVQASLGYAHSFTSKFSANVLGETGLKINAMDDSTFNYVLGGYGDNFINNFKSFYGYDYLALPSNSFLKATINLDYEFIKKNHLSLSANFANIEDNLYQSTDWFSLPDYSGYAIGLGVETFLGPIEAKYSWSPDTKENHWFFNLGFWF